MAFLSAQLAHENKTTFTNRKPPGLQMQMSPIVQHSPTAFHQIGQANLHSPGADLVVSSHSPQYDLQMNQLQLQQMQQQQFMPLHRSHSSASLASGSSGTTYSASTPGSLLYYDATNFSTPSSSPMDVMSHNFPPSSKPRHIQRSMSSSSLASSSNFSTYSDSSSASIPLNGRLRSSGSSSSLPTIPSASAVARTQRTRPAASGLVKPKRSSKLSDSDRKHVCEHARDHPRDNQDTIGARFGIERSTVSKILKDKARWLAIPEEGISAPFEEMLVGSEGNTADVSGRTEKPSKFPQLEGSITAWVRQRVARGQETDDEEIKRFALAEANSLGIRPAQFRASNTWLDRYKSRIGLKRSDGRTRSNGTIDEQPSEMETEESPSPSQTAQSETRSIPNSALLQTFQQQLPLPAKSVTSNALSTLTENTPTITVPHARHHSAPHDSFSLSFNNTVPQHPQTHHNGSIVPQWPHGPISPDQPQRRQAFSQPPSPLHASTTFSLQQQDRQHEQHLQQQHDVIQQAQNAEIESYPAMIERPGSRRAKAQPQLQSQSSHAMSWSGGGGSNGGVSQGPTQPVQYDEAISALSTLSRFLAQRPEMMRGQSVRALQELSAAFEVPGFTGADFQVISSSADDRSKFSDGLAIEY